MIERYHQQYTPVCDYCEKRLPGGESFAEAVQIKRDAGWISRKVNGEWEDICTDCQFEEKGYAPPLATQSIDSLSLPGFAEAKAYLEKKGFPSAWITKTVDLAKNGAIFLKNGRPCHKSQCVNYKGFWLHGCVGSVQCDACKDLLPGLIWDTTCKGNFEKCPFYSHEAADIS